MRARAGDPPRTMPQKILAGRASDPTLESDLVEVKVDQVILSREPAPVLGEALRRGLTKAAVETAVAYDGRCITSSGDLAHPTQDTTVPERLPGSLVKHGVLLARPGIGFSAAVHLERFAAPARLALTDDPRLASLGGAGLLTLVASPSQLADVLVRGRTPLRPVRSIQVLLSGKLRPFVGVRDVALELLRDGLADAVERIDRAHQAPVVLEFAGQSARLMAVADRAILCGLASQVGAAGAVFVSDEKTEVYLRDQRRSKAHRTLQPDPGAPCDDVISLDLSSIDPLLMDPSGNVKPVRDLEGQAVSQVLLGGDCGASLRDLLTAAALLKSKRVPSGLDFLLAPPSRQVLEVLASSGKLVDLIATGARVVEPDERLMRGELYPPPADGQLSLRSFDPAPGTPAAQRGVVASAETLAFAVASGELGDPRNFKRPVRVTVPRTLPTDDVLIVRKAKRGDKNDSPDDGLVSSEGAARPSEPPVVQPWEGPSELRVSTNGKTPDAPTALVCINLEQVRWAADHADQFSPHLRVVAASYLPAAFVPMFAGLGILALTADQDVIGRLRTAHQIKIPELVPGSGTLEVQADGDPLNVRWLAVADERDWTIGGMACAAT